ncbi:hypothetical protein PoB_004085000 [Plakobranchus ocellatus]|uniref:Uncharacterized protein n=1 Tax=Plakobranchus ocellatus TaxID=259542 RepID=A0AAV4B430_9GAST|nr:hypothetical protein PoB_004085000 [Plakobranchus ocellatus]
MADHMDALSKQLSAEQSKTSEDSFLRVQSKSNTQRLESEIHECVTKKGILFEQLKELQKSKQQDQQETIAIEDSSQNSEQPSTKTISVEYVGISEETKSFARMCIDDTSNDAPRTNEKNDHLCQENASQLSDATPRFDNLDMEGEMPMQESGQQSQGSNIVDKSAHAVLQAETTRDESFHLQQNCEDQSIDRGAVQSKTEQPIPPPPKVLTSSVDSCVTTSTVQPSLATRTFMPSKLSQSLPLKIQQQPLKTIDSSTIRQELNYKGSTVPSVHRKKPLSVPLHDGSQHSLGSNISQSRQQQSNQMEEECEDFNTVNNAVCVKDKSQTETGFKSNLISHLEAVANYQPTSPETGPESQSGHKSFFSLFNISQKSNTSGNATEDDEPPMSIFNFGNFAADKDGEGDDDGASNSACWIGSSGLMTAAESDKSENQAGSGVLPIAFGASKDQEDENENQSSFFNFGGDFSSEKPNKSFFNFF